ncbi:hypothetical protein [Aquabacterium sp.]|uniref:hypothetical protein n=1 Tax=Aquabacterium sp. TaxID=1872578 RepID=UPI002B9F7C30|nr:hypothetical protein [Aquabacterium sp.]HSW05160.1 hypothetical protein [Aquabacterium sp.]
MFLKNTWYVACKPEEIEGKPLGRKICNEAMVFSIGQKAMDETPCVTKVDGKVLDL